MKEGRDIDKLFKEGLENPDLPFNDLDWDNLEEKLHPKEKRRIVPVIWFAAATGIAAMLLIVFLFVKSDVNAPTKNSVVKVNGNKKIETESEDKTRLNDSTAQINNLAENGVSNKENLRRFEAKHSVNSISNTSFKGDFNKINDNDRLPLSSDVINGNLLANVNYGLSLNAEVNPVQYQSQKLVNSPGRTKLDKAFSPVFKSKPRLVLSILAAPDLTSVQSSGKSDLSASFGAELTLFLTKKLSITSGAAYAKKIYDSDFSLYRPNSTYVFKVDPTNVHANCDVIDIPLNVNYKVFDNSRNSITVSTGLSSYLMLKEKYSYTYRDEYQKPLDYEVKNQNQHYLGIANVGVEFQHKINNNLSISAKPFMKIPLTDIGYGNSKLSSTGVAVSLNMNLFKKN